MRKVAVLLMVAIVAVSGIAVLRAPVAHAQGGALALNEWVEGTLTADAFETTYTISVTAGDVILIEMYAKLGTYDLDPALKLSDSLGEQLDENDDTIGLGAVIVFEVPADGDYTILATRALGADGSSEGDYILRASQITPLAVGSTVEATIYADDAQSYPSVSVLKPEADGTWAINIAQDPGSDLYANFVLQGGKDDFGSPITLFDLDNTVGIRSGTLNVDLKGGEIYLLLITKGFLSFGFETTEIPVTVTIGEAAQ
ncbi:MAG: hypothetical protein HY862_08860 [Chloroflexi bacterium]|nr:hypothetical protein [Chloroflexota bacterium]